MQLLFKLMNSFGISGHEHNIRKIISKEIKPYVDKLDVDDLGNLIAYKKGKKPRIMLAAHMDEIGLMVKSISSIGKIYFSILGGIEPDILIAQDVHVTTKKGMIHGVITTQEISNDFGEREKVMLDDLFVDTGLTKEQLIKMGVEVGNYIALEQKTKYLGSQEMICGKAVDDRIGCYVLIELAKKLKNIKNEIYYVFTVQEEVGLYGAKVSAFTIEPDLAIAVDVTNSDDRLDSEQTIELGHGPCITIKDAQMIANRALDEYLKKVAIKNHIPMQLDVSDYGTTDAMSISITKGGIPATVVGVAVRNLHTTVGIANKKDIQNCIKLLTLALKNLDIKKILKME